MRPLLLLAATISGADERAPAPRPAPDPAAAAMTAFFDDLKRGDIKAAHARVGSWAKPVFAAREGFAQQWRRMLGWHGPLGAVEVKRDGALVVADVRFARQGYYFAAEAKPDGTLGGFQMMPYESGSANLLWAGHGVRVTAADPKRPADGVVTFAVPGPYREQVPVSLTLAADPPAALKGHKLRRRDDGLNWVLEVTVNPGKDGATVFWEAAVLTRAEPPRVVGPSTSVVEPEAPAEAARWLRPTGCVQSGDPAVVKRAGWLRAGGAYLADYRSAVAKWVSENQGTGKPFHTLDAAAAVGCGGSCTSRANLAAALFRARGVPARTVAHLPLWSGPLYVHWLTEYWHPGVGWEAVEPSQGTAYAGLGGVVVLNVATPEDEDEAVWPNRRSGVMDGAPRLSSRELDGPIRTIGVMSGDLRCWGQCAPLADLDDGGRRYAWAGLEVSRRFDWLLRRHPGLFVKVYDLARLVESLPGRLHDARLDALWAAARKAHAGLTVNDPKRAALTATAQTGGVDGLTAALRGLDPVRSPTR